MKTSLASESVSHKCLLERPARAGAFRVHARQSKKGSEQPKKKQSVFSQFTDAIDFAQTRSEDDRNLIDSAKLSLGGKPKKGEERQKMSKEQYQALRRKVGGTARDYWKDFVEADEVKGYKSDGGASVPGLPFLLAVVAGLVIATVVVSSQTSGPSAPSAAPPSSPAVPSAVSSQE